MGIGTSIHQNMKKNMQVQMSFQKQLILKQRQAQMAFQISMGRQRFKYYQYFYYTVAPLIIIGVIIKKKPQFLAPLFPLSFAYAYQYDMFYGDMFERSVKQADKLIVEYPQKFYLPQHSGVVTIQENGKKLV